MLCNVSRDLVDTPTPRPMRIVDTVDIAVVGAGPGGCWAACRLARAGVRVALVDGSHPREKPCGGGVTGRALAVVADAVDHAALPRSAIRAARFVDTARGRS